MRRIATVLLILAAVPPAACKKEREGEVRVTVIGQGPRLVDPAQGALSTPDAVLVGNVAQGLVRFDAGGNVIGGLAERWNVSDDGMSYIFRIASTNWPDGRKVTAQQVARILSREIGPRSRNELKDTLGAVTDIVAMTDRVIEVRLGAPRPNLLALFAQPDLAILQKSQGTGPFRPVVADKGTGEIRLTRNVTNSDEETTTKEQLLLGGAPVQQAVQSFAAGRTDLVLGGTFADLPFAQNAHLPGGSLQFDPASGLFGLIPVSRANHLDDPDVRRILNQAIDRDGLVAALAVPNLAGRATLLEPGLDQLPAPVAPAWTATPIADRIAALRPQVDRKFGKAPKPTFRIFMPDGPGAALLLQSLARSWGALGFTVERAADLKSADFVMIDEVAPSTSAGWFVRHFRCATAVICDADADKLMDAARVTPVPQQRYALLQQAAMRIEDAQLFFPVTAPVRWSLVGKRISGFAGNRFAVHTLTDLQQRPGTGG